ncbi:STAS domain-containing protein [Actinokineospora cianjurensis]|uniref:Anti-sigma factor antagonist n=1 Tax=Actinokineospora cianjurensis TaxID=585224 RepID=A0A421B2K6_9PSEU|nr:STAS domain-containing protein [Actinokineospora cianjurensis]RLK58533.1 anti-sigma B factor antagonist [Actinokineospora cianjurensis]
MELFSARIEDQGTHVVLSAVGEIDMATAPDFRVALATAAARAERLVVDLTGVRFLGSVGMTALIEAYDHAQRDGVAITFVIAARSTVQRTLEITGLLGSLPVVHTLRQADG